MLDEERLITTGFREEDEDAEQSLRPRNLTEYFGQDKLKKSLSVCEVCGKPFAKMRKNNTQCSFCQRTKSQRSRREKRIAEQALKDAEERTD